MGDFIYANLIFNYTGNDPDGVQIASTSLNNQNPILQNPKDYYGLISRFIVSGYNAPLIVPVIQTNQPNPNLTIYNVALGFNGTYSDPIPVIYVPSSTSIPVPGAVGNFQDVSTQYYYIYTYNALCSMLNTAFEEALTNLNGKIGTGCLEAPFIYYDSVNGITIKAPTLFYGQPNYDPTIQNGTIQIYINSPTAPWFNGQTLSLQKNPSGCNWNIMLFNMVSNLSSDGEHFIQPPQSIQESNNVPSIQCYQVQTNMPILQELSGVPLSDGITPAVPYTYTSILTDLAPDNSNSVGYGISQLYNQVSSLRLFEITANQPMYQIDSTIFWQDVYGRTFPLLLSLGVQCSIKFEFIKKSVYKGTK